MSNFIKRRRLKSNYLKCSILLIFVIIMVLWKSSRSGTWSKRFRHEETEEDIARRIAKFENTDEFLVQVLKEYKYIEIDLKSKRVIEFVDYDEEIMEDSRKIVPGLGEGGLKASVPESQSALAAEISGKDAFNRLLSDMISINRSIPDTREEACKNIEYDKNLPDASIVIIYSNEAFSTLVRTIHSAINKSPSHLIKEVILVDDFSDKHDLQGKLERYLATKFPFGKVRLVKMLKRSGLIRARMIGAHLAIGNVIVFLDAHCECGESWLEPMLQRIKDERTAVVCPIIEVIDKKTLEYIHGIGRFFQIGGFDWSGKFIWINIPDYEIKRKLANHSPTRSPTMAGGLFAIDRKYFWEIGSYDSEMEFWGGENLEMSFRVWQCGGSIEIIPCSKVGHIFRNFYPYSFPTNLDSHFINTARLAQVWMDDYKEYFFSHKPHLKNTSYGDVTKRLELKKRLKCKNFEWYLDNIYKEKFRFGKSSSHMGQVKNKKTNQCLDYMRESNTDYRLSVYPCRSELYLSQTFFLSNGGELRREFDCAFIRTDRKPHGQIEMISCEFLTQEDKWEYKDLTLRHVTFDKCLTVSIEKDDLTLETCEPSSPFQQWTFDK